MSRISISFRVYNNAGKTAQNLRVCAKIPGSTQYHPRAISFLGQGDLIDPDIVKFNSKKQRFEKRAKNSTENNVLLEKIEVYCKLLLDENDPKTIEDFWSLVEKAKDGKPVTKDDRTLEWFLHSIIEEYLDGYANKLPSSNYQTYVRLLHHLEREDERKRSKHILRVPIGKISNLEFQQFGDYLRPLKGPNYLDLMKYFKRAHNIAIRKKLATTPLTYRYMDETPVKTFEELSAMNKGIASLSAQQIEAVESLDLISNSFMNAYKAAGAYYTIKDLILFEGCLMQVNATGDTCIRRYNEKRHFIKQEESLAALERKTVELVSRGINEYGYEMLGLLKEFLKYNNFNFEATKQEWAKQSEARKLMREINKSRRPRK